MKSDCGKLRALAIFIGFSRRLTLPFYSRSCKESITESLGTKLILCNKKGTYG